MKNRVKLLKRTCLLLVLVLTVGLFPLPGLTESENGEQKNGDWVNFLLMCNEGMNNSGGNAGNTMMIVAMDPVRGHIRLMMLTWDTFVHYQGYDVLQRMDMPYRKGGPEETLKVFKDNFHIDVDLFMSLNYLNLATMIDRFGGIKLDITRAERNALNGMVASKKENIQAQAKAGVLSQLLIELLAQEYFLNEYGPETRVNGLQAVGYGWLQYDSVYNCCLRELEVVAAFFDRVALDIADNVMFYTEETGYPNRLGNRRAINLDAVTDDDKAFLRQLIAPIFQMCYHNLSEEEIIGISLTLARVAYAAAREGVDIFSSLETAVFPLEFHNPYDIVAGTKGHLVDYEANTAAMKAFLYAEEEPMP